MNTSLKELLYEAIKAKYPGYLTKDEAEMLCKENSTGKKYNWGDNGTSRLREMSRGESPRVLKVKNENRVIIGYKYIPQKAEIITKPDKAKGNTEILDEQLDELLKTYQTKGAWENYEVIKEIREARKGTSEYAKKKTIEQSYPH